MATLSEFAARAAILSRFGPPMPPSRPHFSAPYYDHRAGVLLDLRAGFDRHISAARAARATGDTRAWLTAVDFCAFYRKRLMAMKRQGWRLGTGGRHTGEAWKDALAARAAQRGAA